MDKTIILWLADFHSGSPVSLYPNETLMLMNGPRPPSRLQAELYKHWREIIEHVALMKAELGARLIVIVLGDAIENDHHESKQTISQYTIDQQLIHKTLINELKAVTNYDKIYYVNGTPSHAQEDEYDIATALMAERYAPNQFTWPILKKTVDGHLIYAAHQGTGAGKGANRGNALRNNLKNLCIESTLNNQQLPDMVVYAHMHDACHETYHFGKHTVEGFVLPSFKLMDEYVYRVNAFAFNQVGAMVTTCQHGQIESEFFLIHVNQDPIGEL